MIHRPAHYRRHGVALLLAIAVMAIVAASVVALLAATSRQARRALDDSQTAQLEQLLLAAHAEIPQHLQSNPPAKDQSWEIPVPNVDARIHVTLTEATNARVALTVRATYINRSQEERAVFTHEDSRWKLDSVTLD